MTGKMSHTEKMSIQLAVIASRMEHIEADLQDIKKKLSDKYVTQDQLEIVRQKVQRHDQIIFGVITLITTAFLTALVALVWKV